MNRELVLASTSIYRKKLLEKLGMPFIAKRPHCDEDHFKQIVSDPLTLATTLSREKALSLKDTKSVIIGGDQLISFHGEVLGKPHTREKNIEQLHRLSGQAHTLITAVTVLSSEKEITFVDETHITFKNLSNDEITKYVDFDLPMDCAGGYKFESRGITLIEKLHCSDPSAIEGLPLIELSKVLKTFY